MWMAARDISYVRQALGPITPRACANGAESAIFEIHSYRERKLWKKRSVAQEWARTWVWCIADHCLCNRANGALAALDCKFGSYTVDCCSECWLQWETIAIIDIWRRPTDSGITRYTYCTLLANSVATPMAISKLIHIFELQVNSHSQ